MKQLPLLPLKEKYYSEIRKEIERILDEILYKPLLETLREYSAFKTTTGKLNKEYTAKGHLKSNSLDNDPLYHALKEGTIWYEDGQFKGKFNARISKQIRDLGGHYNKKTGTWGIEKALVPAEIMAATAIAASRYETLRKAIFTTLDMVNIESIDRISRLADKYETAIRWVDDDFQKAVKAVTVAPQLTQEQLGTLTAEYTESMDRYVKGWTQDNVVKLREMVQKEVLGGKRAESIAKIVEKNYGVGKRKAQFLARQEAGLFMSHFKEIRYRDIGSTKYRWSTSNDERVRHDHAVLDNTIQLWSNPPITNLKTGARNHPQQDFGCRCQAIALLD